MHGFQVPRNTEMRPCVTSSVTTIVLYKTGTPECDGEARLYSTGQTESTITGSTECSFPFTAIVPGPEDYRNYNTVYEVDGPFERPPPQFPRCKISRSECDTQWNSFRGAMKDFMVAHEDYYWNFHAGRDAHFPCTLEGEDFWDPGLSCLQIHQWIDVRGYTGRRGFFDNCPQPGERCMAQMRDRRSFRGLGIDPRCEVTIDRFVLIHFPPEKSNPSKNLCETRNSAPYQGNILSNLTATVTATLDTIVFAAKDSYARAPGEARPPIQDLQWLADTWCKMPKIQF
jgi:hypothetical protein